MTQISSPPSPLPRPSQVTQGFERRNSSPPHPRHAGTQTRQTVVIPAKAGIPNDPRTVSDQDKEGKRGRRGTNTTRIWPIPHRQRAVE